MMSQQLWMIAGKALLVELWFERDSVFREKHLWWSAWCSLSKFFAKFFIQDICLNLGAFISSN